MRSSTEIVTTKDDGYVGDNWSYKTCKVPLKLSPPTTNTQFVLQAGCPSCCPTSSVGALNEKQGLPNLVYIMLRHPGRGRSRLHGFTVSKSLSIAAASPQFVDIHQMVYPYAADDGP